MVTHEQEAKKQTPPLYSFIDELVEMALEKAINRMPQAKNNGVVEKLLASMPDNGKAYLTVDETAKFLGVSHTTIYECLRQTPQTIPGHRLQSKWLIPKLALVRWLEMTPIKQESPGNGPEL
jgi:excisionase family DNA binding protein